MKASRFRILFRVACMAALGCALASTTGCVVTAVGAGVCYKKYRQGAIQSIERVPFDESWSALQSAMTELGYEVTHSVKRLSYGVIKADAGGDKTIQIRLEPEELDWTEIEVRVGLFGDEVISRSILAAIRRQNAISMQPDRDALIRMLAAAP